MLIHQNRPLEIICDIYIYAFQCFMYCNVRNNKHLCGTNLCNRHLTHIIHINKTRAENITLRYLITHGSHDYMNSMYMYM